MCFTCYLPIDRIFLISLLKIYFIYSCSICETPKLNQPNDKSNACKLQHFNTHTYTYSYTYTHRHTQIMGLCFLSLNMF